jgi:hypothetical protein
VETVAISTAPPANQFRGQINGFGSWKKGPPMAGFRGSADGLHALEFAEQWANLPKVASHYREYSRFWETRVRDRVRSVPCGGLAVGISLFSGTRRVIREPASAHCVADAAVRFRPSNGSFYTKRECRRLVSRAAKSYRAVVGSRPEPAFCWMPSAEYAKRRTLRQFSKYEAPGTVCFPQTAQKLRRHSEALAIVLQPDIRAGTRPSSQRGPPG